MALEDDADLLRMIGQESVLGISKPLSRGRPGTAIPPAGLALLHTIGSQGYESNGSYTQRFNQPDFSDFSKHPATLGKIMSGPNRGRSSDAAGRYQFLSTTYADQAKKLGLKDFSPASQDLAAWNLAKETYAKSSKGADLAADLENPAKLPAITQSLKSQWTSLPGGIESRSKLPAFQQAFNSNLQAVGGGQPTETASAAKPASEPAPATTPSAAAAPLSYTPRPTGIVTSDNWARGDKPASGPAPAIAPSAAANDIGDVRSKNPIQDAFQMAALGII